jgi:pimeloyl-ACP methyl ester carboxylesterase
LHQFTSDGVAIAYRDLGTGDPILLIHGFASNSEVNWVSTSWTDTLVAHSRRVIAMDVRGHGASGKLYRPQDYTPTLMAADAAGLIDHLALGRVDVMGYSMGARIATRLTLDHPDKVRSLVIAGMGMHLVDGMDNNTEDIAAGLEADRADPRFGEVAAGYRAFAVRTHSDLRALAMCMRGQRASIPPGNLARLRLPVLVAVGENDAIAGDPAALAALIPGAVAFVIPRRDHMRATGDKAYKAAVIDFLRERP